MTKITQKVNRILLTAADRFTELSILELDLNRPYKPKSMYVVCDLLSRREFDEVEYDEDTAFYTLDLQAALNEFLKITANLEMTFDTDAYCDLIDELFTAQSVYKIAPYENEIDAREDATDSTFDYQFEFCPANHYPAPSFA